MGDMTGEQETAFLFADDWTVVADCSNLTDCHWAHEVVMTVAELHQTLGHHKWCVANCEENWSSYRQNLRSMQNRNVIFTFRSPKDATKFILRFCDQVVHN